MDGAVDSPSDKAQRRKERGRDAKGARGGEGRKRERRRLKGRAGWSRLEEERSRRRELERERKREETEGAGGEVANKGLQGPGGGWPNQGWRPVHCQHTPGGRGSQ